VGNSNIKSKRDLHNLISNHLHPYNIGGNEPELFDIDRISGEIARAIWDRVEKWKK